MLNIFILIDTHVNSDLAKAKTKTKIVTFALT